VARLWEWPRLWGPPAGPALGGAAAGWPAGPAPAAAAAYGTHQLPLSPVLQLAVLAGVLATAALIVLLTRR